MAAFLPFDTARLRLRPFTPADAPAFAAYRSDPDVARYQGWPTPFTVEDATRLIDEQVELDGPVAGRWIQIALERSGTLAGDVAVGLDADARIATLGYTLAPVHQGHGLAREAVGAVLDRLFDDIGIHRVEASLDPRNVASARLVEDLGFEFEGTAVSAELVRGEWTDDARYGLTDAQRAAWRSRPHAPPTDVRLVEVTPANRRTVLALATHRSQRRFVSPMAESFTDALVPDLVGGAPVVPWFRAIEADGELTGFLMLAERTAAHPEAYLWRFLVDRRHQRRGIGDRALALLVARLRSEGNESLLVSWWPDPGGPEPFYLARGFVPTGRVDDGEIEARLTL